MSTNEPVNAEAPFNDPKADVILRSSDNVDFRTFRVLLSLASPVFETMFGLPQPGKNDGLPVVSISEHSRTIETLLKLLDPRCLVLLDSIDDIGQILEMSKKYDMEGVADNTRAMAKRVLLQVETNDPIRAYAVATRFQLKDEAIRAARGTLRLSMSKILDQTQGAELKYISGTQLHGLYSYHHKCGRAASALASTSTWAPHTSPSKIWFSSHSSCTTSAFLIDGSWCYPKTWWVEYMRASSAELASQPYGITVKKPELVDTALKKATACGMCRDRVFEELPKFLETYAAEVERVVSEVKADVSEKVAVILIQHGSA
jgi:hypothetical protein